jgi:prophage regulatory protein
MKSLLRKPTVLERLGIQKSKLSDDIRKGLIPPPIKIGNRAVAWVSTEIDCLVDALIAGKSKTEIKTLITYLVKNRTGGMLS